MIFDLFSCWSSNRKPPKTTETASIALSDTDKISIDQQIAAGDDPADRLVQQYTEANKLAAVDTAIYVSLAQQFEHAYKKTGRGEFLLASAVIELTKLHGEAGHVKNGRTKVYLIGHFDFNADFSKLGCFVTQFTRLVQTEVSKRPLLNTALACIPPMTSSGESEHGLFAQTHKKIELQRIWELELALTKINPTARLRNH